MNLIVRGNGEGESDNPVQRSPGRSELVYFCGDSRVFHKGRRVVGFEAGVDDERSAAAPVFVFGEASQAVNVVRGVGASKGGPEEVIESAAGECAVVYQ